MAHKILKNHDDAEDVCQDVFRKLIPRYQNMDAEYLIRWLLVVSKNTALKLKDKKKRLLYLDLSRIDCETDSQTFKNDFKSYETEKPESLLTDSPLHNIMLSEKSQEFQAGLYKALNELPARLQEIIRLRYFEELSYAEIASKLKLTQGNVGFLLNRAMTKIKKSFACSKVQR